MKKKNILIIAAILAVIVIAAVLVWYLASGKNKSAKSQETTVKIETSAGQEVVFAQLTSVKGNEITYTVAEEAGEAPDGGMSQIPGSQGDDVSRGDQMIGGPGGKGGQRPEGGRSGMGHGGQNGQSTYAFSYDGIDYQLTEESCTELIPVGTEVITKLGTVTTFSRLAAGDNVALVVEDEGDEQVIVAVYIIG